MKPEAALRVCADPNDLPYSNDRREGFENALAELVAADLKRRLQFVWWPQRRGFIANTLQAGRCDVVMGVTGAAGSHKTAQPAMLTTRPYYRSTYVIVSRHDRDRFVDLSDDAQLRRLRIGVHVTGASGTVPPALALVRRGLVDNLRGYSIYGDYSRPHPASALIEAVARDEIDIAMVWGPLAGYFAPRQSTPLDISPLPPGLDSGQLPMTFDISMAVRQDDTRLRIALDEVLKRRASEVERLLTRYGVPLGALSSARRSTRTLEY